MQDADAEVHSDGDNLADEDGNEDEGDDGLDRKYIQVVCDSLFVSPVV